MTACLYISPGNAPALMADVVVSKNDERISPVPFEQRRPHSDGTSLEVARKVYILSKRTAIVTSGDSYSISRFLEDVQENIAYIERRQRPSVEICEIANGYTGLSLICSSVVMRDEGILEECFSTSESELNSQIFDRDWIFGLTAAIGVGEKRLIRYLESIHYSSSIDFHLALDNMERDLISCYPALYPDSVHRLAAAWA